jgi:anti-sigma-K factor RskA
MDIREYIASGVIELYVMGLCSVEEKKELEGLRRQYPELEQAIRVFEKELEEKMQKDIVFPDAETDEKILAGFGKKTTSAKIINPEFWNRSINWWRPVAAAAILLLLVCSYFIYSLSNKTRSLEEKLASTSVNESGLPASDYAIMMNPQITPVAMYGVGTHAICRCTMFWDKKTGKLYIMIHHLPRSSSSRRYQLWAMVNNEPVSVGIIQDEIRGRFIEMKNVPAGAVSFIVTLENEGGNNTPTMEETYLAGRI